MAHPQVPVMSYTMPMVPMEPDSLRNLMVNYIPTTIDETQLRQLFEMYGPIESIKIVSDRETHQSRGYGFVKYRYGYSAVHAIQYLNGYPLMNKRLKVAYANAPDAQKAIAAGELSPGVGYQMGMPMTMGYPYQGYSPSEMAYFQQQQLQMLQYQQFFAQQSPQSQQNPQGMPQGMPPPGMPQQGMPPQGMSMQGMPSQQPPAVHNSNLPRASQHPNASSR